MTVDRRDFVKYGVTSALAARSMVAGALAPSCIGQLSSAWAAAADELPIVDTHQHLWDLVEFQPPWLGSADAKIAAKHAMSNYLAETAGLNVVKAIYMEVDVAPADQVKEADFILAIIAKADSPTVAAVISGRPGSEGFAKYMQRHRDNELIKGVRQVLHAGSAERGLCVQPQFVKSIQLLGEMGKRFDLCMRPTELADGAALAEKCPNTRFIVDHCGNADPAAWKPTAKPTGAPAHTVAQWKTDMGKLAQLPNVICKISGIVAQAPNGWTPDYLAPAINFCLDEFGPDRVVFGGDWPVCKLGASYAEWVAALKQLVSSRPLVEQKKLFHDNAMKFYRLA